MLDPNNFFYKWKALPLYLSNTNSTLENSSFVIRFLFVFERGGKGCRKTHCMGRTTYAVDLSDFLPSKTLQIRSS